MTLKAKRRSDNGFGTKSAVNAPEAGNHGQPWVRNRIVTMALGSVAISLLGFDCLAADGSRSPEIEVAYEQAMLDYKADRCAEALKSLEIVDSLAASAGDKAESLNLRGVILTRECEYEAAELALRRAIEIEPGLWNARFNFAQIPFRERSWAEARCRFEAILTEADNRMEDKTRQVIRYKILLTHVLEGNEPAANQMIKELEQEPESPGLYYARAAIALQHDREDEAKGWMASARERFSAPLTKLYGESFYEIGWNKKPAGEERESFEIVRDGGIPAAQIQANLKNAESAFLRGEIVLALALLDRLDALFPSQAASHNLRAEILIGQKKFDQAENELQRALAADPKFREAAYNLAGVAFKKQRYREARDGFERLFGEIRGGRENQAAQLMKFKIFLTFLLEDRESDAQLMMDRFEFTGATPALYYAKAAWEFHHASREHGSEWIEAARRIYSPALNIIFADSFYDLGWLEGRPSDSASAIDGQPSGELVGPIVSLSPNECEMGEAVLRGSTPR